MLHARSEQTVNTRESKSTLLLRFWARKREGESGRKEKKQQQLTNTTTATLTNNQGGENERERKGAGVLHLLKLNIFSSA